MKRNTDNPKNYTYSIKLTREQKEILMKRDILRSFLNRIVREYVQVAKDVYEISVLMEMEDKLIKTIKEYRVLKNNKFKIGDNVVLKSKEHQHIIYQVKSISLNENYENVYKLHSIFGESFHKEEDILGRVKVEIE